MLALKNGFYAFELALHVFPAQSCDQHIGLDLWNSETLWRSAYGEVTNGCGFFAEDIFGGQFCFNLKTVVTPLYSHDFPGTDAPSVARCLRERV